MKNKIQSMFVRGLQKALNHDNGPRLPRHWKVITSTLSRFDSLSIVSRQSDLDGVGGISALFSPRVYKYVACLLMVLCLGIGNVWGALNNTTVTKAGSSQKYIDVTTTAASEGDEVTVEKQYIAYTINDLISSSIKDVWYTQQSSGSGSSATDAVSITGYRTACNKYIPFSSSKTYTFYVTNCVSFSVLYDPRGNNRYCTITATNVDDGEDVLTTTHSGTISSGNKYNVELSGLSASKYYRVVLSETTSNEARHYQIRLGAYVNTTGPFAITYNKNDEGASGTMTDASSPYAKNSTVTVLANSFTAPTGKVFAGWNTKANGTGAPYDAGDTFSATEDVTLYAQWAYPATGTGTITYTLTSNKNEVNAAVTGVNTLSSTSTAFALSTLTCGSGNSKNGYSGQIQNHAADYSASQYVALQFTVADGYTFNPSSVAMTVFANSTSYMKMKVKLTDGTVSVESNELSCSSSADSDISFASGAFTNKKFAGNVDVIVYQWGVTSKRTYIKSPVTITGTVAPACQNVSAPTVLAENTEARTVNSLTYTWTKADHASGYTATLYSDSGCETEVESKNLGDVATVTFSGLSPNTNYWCKVQSKGDGSTYCAEGSITSAVQGTTAAPSCGDVTAPTQLQAGSITTDGATFTITDAADAFNYELYVSESSTTPESSATATYTSTTKSKEVTGLTSGTTYYAWVRSVCDADHKSSWVALSGSSFKVRTTPTASFADAEYVIGASAIDVAANFSSNSEAAVVYELKEEYANVTLSGSMFSATVAGEYVVVANQAGNATYMPISKEATVTVVPAPTHMVENRLNVASGNWSSTIYTNDGTNISNLVEWQIAAGQDRTAGVTDKQSIKNNRTHGIGTTSEKVDGYYMYLSFKVADGKRLKLSAVNIPVFGISANKTTLVEIEDANSTKISVNGTITADHDGNGFGSYTFSEAPYLKGVVTMKMWAYGATSGYRMKSPIYLDGVISDIPATYSVTYVPNNGITPAETMTDSNSPYEAGAEVTLLSNTFTAPTGQLFDGWVATYNDGENDHELTITNGKFTMPAYNVTVTAQWADATATYDITYVSAHGTAPAAANAASATLAELSESGWQHVGWTADVDVTVDAETVTAGTLIANGKTAILASDVIFTAVWNQIFTVTYNANGGTCATAEATWKAGDAQLVLPAATKDNFDFVGWYDAATGGNKIGNGGANYTPSASIELFAHYMPKLVQAIYSNTFDAFIKNQAVTVYYLQGEAAPTLSSIVVLGQDAPVFEEVDGNIKVTIETVDYIFPVTKTAVAPYTYVNGDPITFDGTETYIKTGNAFSTTSGKEGWKFSKNDNDWSRETPGNNRIYFFIGAAESITLTSGCSSARAMKVYRNGTQVFDGTMPKNSSSPNYVTLTGSNAPAMYAVVSNQTDGDGAIKIMALAPWVSVETVTLKEGEDAISSKEIYAGANFTLTAEVTPDNASDKTITWTSSNNDVATVVNGVVTGVAANATPVTITASTVDGVTATCAVTVTAAPEPCETPVITADPASQAYCAGSEPTLTVAANVPSDGGTLHYAWFKAGETDEAVGTDAASYTVEAAGTYYVIVTNKKDGNLDASATSANAVVTLNTPASITTQPTDLKKQTEGANITLSVVAANATGYQWYSCDNKDKENPSLIAGADEAEYEFAAAAGFFYCEVTGLCGTIESNVAEVTVKRSAGCQYITATSGSQATLTDGTIMYACGSDGKLSTGDNFATASANAKSVDADAVGAINKQYCVVKFPADVEEITLYGYNSSSRSVNNLCYGTAVGTDVKVNTAISSDDYVKTASNDGYERSMTIEFDEPFAKEKYLFIKYNSALEIYRICYTAALVEPKLPTLADQELCAGAAIAAFDATITNAAACEGTVSYKWFSTADTETPVATTAEFTPSTEGTYYVVVTHSAAGHITRTVQSDNLTVAHFDALTLVSNSGDVFQHMGTAATLSVVATGKNVAYVWYTCSNAAGDDAVAIDPAETESSLTIASVAEGVQYYKVVISHDCDATTLSHVFKVEGWNQLDQVDVTATTTWDMTNVSADHIELTGSDKNARLLLANIDGVNNTTFNAQALMFEGQHIGRTDKSVKHLAGRYVQFNVTVPGAVFVTFESNGDNARTISINGKKCARTTSGTAADKYITYALAVEPGSVEIIGYEGESANQYVRISKIEFKAEDNYHRTVNPSFLGTLCWKNNAILGGGTLYKFVGKNEYNYLVFEDVPENRLEAGKPYIFMPENGNTEIKLYNTDDAEPLTTNQAHVNHMYGTIVDTDLYPTTDVNMYYFSSNHIWAVKDFTVEKITVPAYYCYVDYPAVLAGDPAPDPAPGRRRVTMGINGNNAPTDVENVQSDEVQCTKVMINGQLFILRGEKMFDATGRLVK